MIEFNHVTKRYPGQTKASLTDVSLEIQDGDFCALMGPSGAGKSTFLKLLYGAIKPTYGHLKFMQQDLATLTASKIPFLRRNIGVVFQDFKLIDHLTVLENVGLVLKVREKSTEEQHERALSVLREVGLHQRARELCAHLSGGEKQRVAIARALVAKPKLLLCDEPTGNLDSERAKEIVELLVNANLRGATIIVATHDPYLILSHRKRDIFLSQGKLVAKSTVN